MATNLNSATIFKQVKRRCDFFKKSALLVLVAISLFSSVFMLFNKTYSGYASQLQASPLATTTTKIINFSSYGKDSQGMEIYGDGTTSNPYLIGTYADFKTLAECSQTVVNGKGTPYVNCSYKVIADIDMQQSGTWIGYFSGTFDGNYHKFTNIKNVRTVNVHSGGLFNRLDNATVKNVILFSGNVKGKEYVGGLAAFATDSTIVGCVNVGVKVEQTSLRKYDYDTVTNRSDLESFDACYGSAGGLVGAYFLNERYNYYSSGDNGVFLFSDCINYANVTSVRTAGGIVGMIFDDRVRCRQDNNITSYLTDCIPINKCYNAGSIVANPKLVQSGESYANSNYYSIDQSLLISVAGGIVGEIECYGLRYYSWTTKGHQAGEDSITVSFSKCFNTGEITSGWSQGTGSSATGNKYSFASGIAGLIDTCWYSNYTTGSNNGKKGTVRKKCTSFESGKEHGEVECKYVSCCNSGNITSYAKVFYTQEEEATKEEKCGSVFNLLTVTQTINEDCSIVFAHAYGLGFSTNWDDTTTSSCYNIGSINGNGNELHKCVYNYKLANWGTEKVTFVILINMQLFFGPTVNLMSPEGKYENTYYTQGEATINHIYISDGNYNILATMTPPKDGSYTYDKASRLKFEFYKAGGHTLAHIKATCKVHSDGHNINCTSTHADISPDGYNNSAGEKKALSVIESEFKKLTDWDVVYWDKINKKANPTPYLQEYYW